MSNLNVNIAKKLISYVRHGVDINEDIKQIYNNSMIFIGDEGQIFVPAMNTYVGIGQTAYNATIDRIAGVEEQIKLLADTLSTDLVSKIYANYSSYELISNHIASELNGAMITKDLDPIWALNNDITLKGYNDYDPSTGWARTVANPYVIKTADGTYTTGITANQYYHNGHTGEAAATDSAIPTSGITITPYWGAIQRDENPVTHQVVEKRFGSYITIDDKLTWSYMTSAYAYTLNFAQRYTANEVDRLYHNLLGDYQTVYAPINLGYVVSNITSVYEALSADDKANYALNNNVIVASTSDNGIDKYWAVRQNAGNLSYATYTSTYTTVNGEQVITSTKEYHEITPGVIAQLIEGTNVNLGTNVEYTSDYDALGLIHMPQLYVADTQYDSTYNMNIQDGINTLKEVAYLLDLLSDGTLGKTTYVTWQEVLRDGSQGLTEEQAAQYTGPEIGADDTFTLTYIPDGESTSVEREYHVIYKGTNTTPRPNETYAYWINRGDEETLGIQIAYSIAGNKMDIEDLHKHTDLIEKGETSLRSIKTKNSNFVEFSTIGGKADWTNTDANQGKDHFDDMGHPNYHSYTGHDTGSYLVGDVKLQVKLNTATTYATSYTAEGAATYSNKYFIDEYGGEWWGCYTTADMNNLDPANGTYYTMSGPDANGSYTFTAVDAADVEVDPRDQAADLQYYWIPNSDNAINDYQQNRTFIKISKADLQSAGVNDVLGVDAAGQNITKANCQMFYHKEVSNEGEVSYLPITYNSGLAWAAAAATEYTTLYFLQSYADVAVHAYVGENALATTEWTGALIDSKVGAIADDLEDILQQAKDYTDEQIDKLDNQYIYSDFAEYWANYLDEHDDPNDANLEVTFTIGQGAGAETVTFTYSAVVVVNSYEYTFAYNQEYEKFKAANRVYLYENPINGENPARLSYIANSQYVFDVVEENGIVNAQTRELPEDKFAANAEVWGDNSNVKNQKYDYIDIDITGYAIDPETGKPNRQATLFERLYAWQKANNDTDNQVFVRDTTLESYYPLTPDSSLYVTGWEGTLPTANLVGGSDVNSYVFRNGAYVEFTAPMGFDYFANTNDKNWEQLYQKGPKYVELNFADTSDNIDLSQKNTITIGDYVLTKSGNNIAVTKSGNSLGNLKCINSNTITKSTKYFSVETKHYSYTDNGHGENAVSVTAHITRIEDAAQDNTGFADAYDVQTWVENYFKWIDISATVTDTIVEHSDKYHKRVSLAEYLDLITNGSTAASYTVGNASIPKLYSRGSNNGQVFYTDLNAESISVNTAYFWKDDQTKIGNLTAEQITAGLEGDQLSAEVTGRHVPVEGCFLYQQFNAAVGEISDEYSPADDDYYIRIEESKTNPVNLTLTTYM